MQKAKLQTIIASQDVDQILANIYKYILAKSSLVSKRNIGISGCVCFFSKKYQKRIMPVTLNKEISFFNFSLTFPKDTNIST